MTGAEAWEIVAPMIAPIYALPKIGTPNSEIGMEAYLTVFRALQLLDKEWKGVQEAATSKGEMER